MTALRFRVHYSAAPGLPTTHWFQMRFVFQKPISVAAGQVVSGVMRMIAGDNQSYMVSIDVTAEAAAAASSGGEAAAAAVAAAGGGGCGGVGGGGGGGDGGSGRKKCGGGGGATVEQKTSGEWDLKDPYYRQCVHPQPGYTEEQNARWHGEPPPEAGAEREWSYYMREQWREQQ